MSLERFASRLKHHPNGCVSVGTRGLDKYATVTLDGVSAPAHRVAWMAYNGIIPEGKVIHHLCHNPGCVNPNHLQCVTSSEHARIHGQERLPAHLAAKLRGIAS